MRRAQGQVPNEVNELREEVRILRDAAGIIPILVALKEGVKLAC